MNLRQLEYLEAVLDTGSFTAAAARCHVAQPALWAQVRALESEWGLALFEKIGRGVRPTSAAHALRSRMRVVLGQAASLAADAERLRTGETGSVRIGTTPYHVTHFLAEAIATYVARHPHAPLPECVPVTSADPFVALEEGQVELLPATRRASLPSAPLYDVWVLAVGGVATKPQLEVRELRDVPLAVMTQDFSSRRMLDDACTRARITPNIVFEDRHAESVLAIARQGLATAIVVNEAVARGEPMRQAALIAQGKRLEASLALHWRDDATLSTAARQLRDVIVELAAKLAPRGTRKRRP